MKRNLWGAICLFAVLSYSELLANCGVAFCPVIPGPGEQAPFAASLYSRFSSFDLPGGSGSYLELMPSVSYTKKSYHAMLHVPVVGLFKDGSTFGLGNPMVLAEYRAAWNPVALALGSQFELPLGDHESGLAGDHFLALPYATVRLNQGSRLFYSGTLGMSNVIGSHDEAAPTAPVMPVFVNPHGDRELVYRVMAGIASKRYPNHGSLETYWQGQIVLSHDDEGAQYGQAGIRGTYPVTSILGVNGFTEFHGTNPSRYDWRVGLGFDLRPGIRMKKASGEGVL